jgi:hypothetical protein
VTLGTHLLDLLLCVANSLANTALLDLDLLLTKTTARSDSTSPPTDLTVVGIRPDQSWQQVMQTRRFDLQAALMGAGMLGKDLEDDLGPIEDARLDVQLQVALLSRAQVFVADDEVERTFQLHVAQRLDLAHSNEVRRIDLGPALHVGAHDLRTRGAGQVGQLGHLVAEGLGGRAREEDPD